MSEALDGEEGHDTEVESGNIEAEARKMGWVPEEEFKGERKPKRFKTAQEFVDDTEQISPHFKRLLADKDKEYEARFDRLGKVLKRQYDADLADIRTAQKAAAKDGDDEEFDRLEAEKTKLISQGPEAAAGAVPDLIVQFKERNTWYETDIDMAEIADAYSQKLLRDNPNLPLADNLKKTEAKLKAMFPDKFGKPAARRHADVDGGSENGGGSPSKKGKGWADLPPEFKKAYANFDPRIKKNLTQEKYAEQVWSVE